MTRLYTIGHSTHELTTFLDLLQRHQITAVADVRSSPYSRYNPQFNRESLRQALRASGIAYVFLGDELGARSKNPDCYDGNRVQYERLAKEPMFQIGLTRVREGMTRHSIALMCAERDPMECHRTILVCRHLKSPEIDIVHIHADGGTERHSELELRMMKLHGIMPDLVRGEDYCLGQAYRVQGERIAYVRSAEPAQGEAQA
jgi:uncharacterized protein (DUF488 family)